MKITVIQTIPEVPDFRKVEAGEWQAEPATIQLPGRQRRECRGYDLRRRQPGYGWVSAALSHESWEREVRNGNIIIQEEGDMTNLPAANGSKIYPAMLAAMDAIGAIGKGRKNPQQGYSFRGIDDVLNNLQPALIKAGVFVIPRISDLHREERQTKAGGTMIYTTVRGEYDFISAEDGSKVTACTYGEGMDTSDKSTNKAMSAALKYAIIQAFSIPTDELLDSERDHIEPKHKLKPASVQPQDDGLRHAEPQAPPPIVNPGEATKDEKSELLAKSIEKFKTKGKAMEFIKWCQGTDKYWTSKMVKDFMEDFDSQAALFADSQRSA